GRQRRALSPSCRIRHGGRPGAALFLARLSPHPEAHRQPRQTGHPQSRAGGAMMEPSLALQKAIRARLIGTPAVTALVPAANMLDKNSRPEVFPSIIIGEAQTVPG